MSAGVSVGARVLVCLGTGVGVIVGTTVQIGSVVGEGKGVIKRDARRKSEPDGISPGVGVGVGIARAVGVGAFIVSGVGEGICNPMTLGRNGLVVTRPSVIVGVEAISEVCVPASVGGVVATSLCPVGELRA